MPSYFAIGLFLFILVGCKKENLESAERRILALEKNQIEMQTKINKIQERLDAVAVRQESHRHKYIVRTPQGSYGGFFDQSDVSEPPLPQAEADAYFKKIKESQENDWLNKIFK